MEHYLTAVGAGPGDTVIVGCRCGLVVMTQWTMLRTGWQQHLESAIEEAGW